MSGQPRYMGAQTTTWWRVSLHADDRLAPLAEAALEPLAQSVSRFGEISEGGEAVGPWRIQALFGEKPDADSVAAALAEASGLAGAPAPDFEIENLGEVDWLALNREQFPPVRAGRFFVHGSHFTGPIPTDAVALCVDAGRAFGSGTHESTRGCLIAIDKAVAERDIARALDLGCGSGLLAMAIAAAAGAEVLATDIDGAAIAVAEANARANGLAHLVRAVREDGVGEAARGGAPYDLVVANILARPLLAMAGNLAEVTAPGGLLILSGLLAREEEGVMAAYGGVGFGRLRSVALGDWTTLVLSSGPAP